MEYIQTKIDAFHAYSATFDGDSSRYLIRAVPDFPLYFVMVYLLVIFYFPDHVMKNRGPVKVWPFVFAWNIFMSIFSLCGSIVMIPGVLDSLQNHGFYGTVCRRQRENNDFGPIPLWIAAFAYAKIPELLDTMFLVLQKKRVSFLQWYHHLATALYCWHSALVRVLPAGIVFAGMNFGVHAFMYFYFALVALGLRQYIRPFAPLITLSQVLQMFVGTGVTVYTAIKYYELDQGLPHLFKMSGLSAATGHGGWDANVTNSLVSLNVSDSEFETFPTPQVGCVTDGTNLRMGLMMYASYCVLFVKLFNDIWVKGRSQRVVQKE